MLDISAKAKAYDLMTFLFAGLMLSFPLFGMEAAPILLFVLVYLFIQGYALYCHYKYSKEM